MRKFGTRAVPGSISGGVCFEVGESQQCKGVVDQRRHRALRTAVRRRDSAGQLNHLSKTAARRFVDEPKEPQPGASVVAARSCGASNRRASVAAITSATLTPAMVSSNTSPAAVGWITAISVTTRSTRRIEVMGRLQLGTSLALCRFVWNLTNLQRCAQSGIL